MPRLFRYLEPTCFSGLIDDPCLIVRDRPVHASIMLDCGSLAHVAKRELNPVRALFVSHAHMDHFMGFDAFLRQVHASPRTVELFGPPGCADRVQARLAGYDWNLAEPYWCTVLVHEVHAGELRSSRFSGPHAFARSEAGSRPRKATIYRFNHLEVAAELLDHGIPVLSFRVRERKMFRIDPRKLAARGLVPGPWMVELKRRFFTDWQEPAPLVVMRELGNGRREELREDARLLYRSIRGRVNAAGIGYLTDIGFTGQNRERAERFLAGVDLLVGECAFLRGERHKARRSHHLCTDDVNELLRQIRPRFFLPLHLSKTYLGRSDELYDELSPPAGTTVIRLPEHLPPRPFCAAEALQLHRLAGAITAAPRPF
ncbi:MBL fold metallo-hydrolase [Trichlorobacter ammonificans]|uniref:Metal-dependent hydrolases of the beta-lactamase superfamily III n=1 Tax=Trichlorobacter ammonificans TaxID=2916410 RepID=A0ABN8HGD3_9BACT|nr:MBL fold metallo-hydrolase [Trichlorobacter ammonificans]CAH2030247.1 Metal-dependent hydrolases of the beta-lactamase superfamily III [Trichlorobacter ammonificans]